MFAAAFEGIAGALSSAYGGPFAPAIAITYGEPVYDDGGSIIDPGGVIERPCTAQADAVTEAMRQAQGFSDKDVRLIVLGLDALDTDAAITITAGPHAGSWALQSCDRDPVAVGWVCRARPS